MKLTNKSYMKRITLLVLIPAFVLGIACGVCLIIPNLFSTILFLTMLFLLSLMIFIYSQLRYIEFDSTGEVLVFKSYHPSQKRQLLHEIRAIELPKQKIKKYILKEHFFAKELILEIENSSNKKSKKITFSLSQMDKEGINSIIKELESLLIVTKDSK